MAASRFAYKTLGANVCLIWVPRFIMCVMMDWCICDQWVKLCFMAWFVCGVRLSLSLAFFLFIHVCLLSFVTHSYFISFQIRANRKSRVGLAKLSPS